MRSVNRRFEEKVVVVTGGAGDIGRETIRRFATEGASLVAVDYEGSALEELAMQMRDDGFQIATVKADVSQEDDVRNYVTVACETFGGVDVLFNNAGIEGQCSDVGECDMDDFDRVMGVNVRGVLLGH